MGNDEVIDVSVWGCYQIGVDYFYNMTASKFPYKGVSTASVKMRCSIWYEGRWLIDYDYDGYADDYIWYAMQDRNSDSFVDTVYISRDRINYGEGNLSDYTVTDTNDECITENGTTIYIGTGKMTYGIYFDVNPPWDAEDARIKSRTWYFGRFLYGGSYSFGYPDMYLEVVLSDVDSDGLYEVMDVGYWHTLSLIHI